MLQFSHASWLILPAALLGGCPLYSDGCASSADCAPDYLCDYPSSTCQPIQYNSELPPGPERCTTTSDCSDGLVCDRYLRCVTPGGEAGMAGTTGDVSEAGTGG